MRLLLDHGADVEARDENDLTPLHMAANNGQLAAARLLLERGAIISAPSKSGKTPLIMQRRADIRTSCGFYWSTVRSWK